MARDNANKLEFNKNVLKYCLYVLNERIKNDPKHSWYWNIKKKVALYFLRSKPGFQKKELAEQCKMAGEILSEECRTRIKKEHPLLQEEEEQAKPHTTYAETKWYKKIIERVEKYIEK